MKLLTVILIYKTTTTITIIIIIIIIVTVIIIISIIIIVVIILLLLSYYCYHPFDPPGAPAPPQVQHQHNKIKNTYFSLLSFKFILLLISIPGKPRGF